MRQALYFVIYILCTWMPQSDKPFTGVISIDPLIKPERQVILLALHFVDVNFVLGGKNTVQCDIMVTWQTQETI